MIWGAVRSRGKGSCHAPGFDPAVTFIENLMSCQQGVLIENSNDNMIAARKQN